jgi:16S rRNA (guanine527-N7)-methyltransferase
VNGDLHAAIENAVGRDVSRETFERLQQFAVAFEKWSARINLVAPSTVPHLWSRHILDSAQVIRLAPDAKTWLDLGSGGGFPGAIIAVLLSESADCAVTLVESNAKKAAFLSTVLGSIGVSARVQTARIEAAPARSEAFDVVTARALAQLSTLFELGDIWLLHGSVGFFHKGRDYRREIEECRDGWSFDLVEHPSLVDPESVVLEVRNLRRRAPNKRSLADPT